MPFLETSAKATQNVDMAFETMTKEIKQKRLVDDSNLQSSFMTATKSV